MFTVELKVGYNVLNFEIIDYEDLAEFVAYLGDAAKDPIEFKITKEED